MTKLNEILANERMRMKMWSDRRKNNEQKALDIFYKLKELQKTNKQP